MKVFAASMAAETNSFSAIPTGLQGFEEFGLYRGDGSVKAPDGVGAYVRDIRRLAEAGGHEVTESLAAFAQPAGPIVASTYRELRSRMLEDLERAMPVDVVQLMLHGAMIAEDEEDVEGDILERVRQLVGPGVPVGVLLDLHCHLTDRMLANADAIICFKEYPHVDGEDRAAELFRLLEAKSLGRCAPVMAVFDCRMVGLFPTTREPMRAFVQKMAELEGKDGILSVSLAHGFPWGDVPEGGVRILVIADADREKAKALAEALGWEFRGIRDGLASTTISIDQALEQALAAGGGPHVLADMADNPGGGAPGDSSFILQRLLERQISGAAIGAFWDPVAVGFCKMAGVGASLALRVGGKCGPTSGSPVDLHVTVRALRQDHSQRAYDGRSPLGDCALVETDRGVSILLATMRNQIMGRDAFSGMGLDPSKQSILVVKSAQHFHADFAPIARSIAYVSTPGAVPPLFANIPYRRRDLNFWPRVHAPWSAEPE